VFRGAWEALEHEELEDVSGLPNVRVGQSGEHSSGHEGHIG